MSAQVSAASWTMDGDAAIALLREWLHDMVGEEAAIACTDFAVAPAPRASVFVFNVNFADVAHAVSLLPAIVASRPVMDGWFVSLVRVIRAALQDGIWTLRLQITCWREAGAEPAA